MKKIYTAHVSKHNSKHEKQSILLMISDNKKMALYCSNKIIRIIKRNTIKK